METGYRLFKRRFKAATLGGASGALMNSDSRGGAGSDSWYRSPLLWLGAKRSSMVGAQHFGVSDEMVIKSSSFQ